MLGKTLSGRYKIVKELGSGGFGQTFLAEDLQLPGNPICVVKQLKPQFTEPSALEIARRLFDSEAQVLYRLGNHDQIPRLLAHFEEEQEFYLVQEFIEGDELRQELSVGKPLSEIQTIALLQDILKILEFVHQQGVIHRDIKPTNLIRRKQDGKIVLIDFGAVKQVSTPTTYSNGHTSLTIAIGSPGYMPNEQIAGRPQLCSDIYAVGMIGIQALTGLPPTQLPADPRTSEILWRERWRQNTLHEKIQASTELAAVLDKMVRYDYRQRYQTPTEALQALQSVTSCLSTPSLLSPSDPTQPLVVSTLPPPTLPPQEELISGSAVNSTKSAIASQSSQVNASTTRKQSHPLIKIGVSIASAIAFTVGIYYFQKTHSLWEEAQKIALENTLPGHASGVTSVVLTPDGQILASSSLDKTIKIRNLHTKEVLHSLAGHTSGVLSLAITSDGKTLVSGSNDKTIKVWNLGTGQLLRTLNGHSDYVNCLAISPDGRTLVSGSNDKTIKVWNLGTGQLLRNLETQGSTNEVGAVAISQDGQTLLSSDSSDIKLWNLSTGKFLRTLEGHNFPVRTIVMSSKGEIVASGSLDGSAKLWNLKTGELLNNFPHGSGEPTQSATTEPIEGVYAVAISPDGQTLVTGSGGNENGIKIWNVRTGEMVRTLEGHSKAVVSLAISPDGQTIYSGSMDGTIKVWRSR